MGDCENGHDVGAERPRTALDWALDWGERLVLVTLYSILVARVVAALKPEASLAGALSILPVLLSEGLVVVFALLRRPAIMTSRRPQDWILATAATCAPLLVSYPDSHPPLPVIVGAAVIWMIGFIVQIHAKISLKWSFGCIPAHRGLVASGPYQYIRHPMYAGYGLSHLAILIMNPTLRNLICYLLSDGLQIPRILAEERLLSRDPRYREYRALVRYRLIPGLF